MDHTLLIVAGLAMLLTTFDITAVVMVMPQIRDALSLDLGGFAWVMDAYSLAFTVCLMAAGLLADRHGRRRAFLAGTAVFTLGSLACALAPGSAWLLVARAVQGMAAAFVVCAGIALVAQRHAQPAQRARAFGWLGTINGSAMALGPAGGGLLAQAFGWHWVFLVNVPLGLAVIAGTLRWVGESRDPSARRIDLAGVLSLSAWLLAAVVWLMHGLRFGGVDVPAALAAASLAGLAALFAWTQLRSANPVFELALFARPAFAALCTVHLALSVGYWSVLVYLPPLLQDGLGHAAQAPLLMLAATSPMVVLPAWSARAAARVPPAAFFSAGLALAAAGAALVAGGAATHSLALALAGMLCGGTATALLAPQPLAGVVGAVPPEQAGAASAVTVILRQGGFALGIALLTAVARASGAASSPAPAVFACAALVTACAALGVAVLLLQARSRAARSHVSDFSQEHRFPPGATRAPATGPQNEA
jgi:MFS family permease